MPSSSAAKQISYNASKSCEHIDEPQEWEKGVFPKTQYFKERGGKAYTSVRFADNLFCKKVCILYMWP
jgi:hypothetical protein